MPALAKSNRVRKFHLGLKGPGLGRFPMRGGRRMRETKTFNRGVQKRMTLGEKIVAMRAKRSLFGEELPHE